MPTQEEEIERIDNLQNYFGILLAFSIVFLILLSVALGYYQSNTEESARILFFLMGIVFSSTVSIICWKAYYGKDTYSSTTSFGKTVKK